MALCTQCGTVFHDDDHIKGLHVCNPVDVPKKGEEIKFQKVQDDGMAKKQIYENHDVWVERITALSKLLAVIAPLIIFLIKNNCTQLGIFLFVFA